jgi:hypothetical protein
MRNRDVQRTRVLPTNREFRAQFVAVCRDQSRQPTQSNDGEVA